MIINNSQVYASQRWSLLIKINLSDSEFDEDLESVVYICLRGWEAEKRLKIESFHFAHISRGKT